MTPKRYRKKPVEVEAVQITEGNILCVAAWCGGAARRLRDLEGTPIALSIPTLEGNMRADFGDFIIRGVEGEFYPCKPGIFHQTYEEVAE